MLGLGWEFKGKELFCTRVLPCTLLSCRKALVFLISVLGGAARELGSQGLPGLSWPWVSTAQEVRAWQWGLFFVFPEKGQPFRAEPLEGPLSTELAVPLPPSALPWEELLSPNLSGQPGAHLHELS